MKYLSYGVLLGIDWLISTNPVEIWVAFSLELTMGAKWHTVLALPMNSVANVTLSSLKQVLAEMKHSCPAWFVLLRSHSLLDTKGVLAVLEGGDSTKVLGTDPSYWELIYSEFSDVLEKLDTPPEKAIKHRIDLLPISVPPTKR